MDKAFRKVIGRKFPSPRNPRPSEDIGVRYDSHITDTIHYADGRTEVLDHGHNTMLDSFLPLITNLLVSGDGKLLYWVLGTGNPTWDEEGKQEIVTFTISQECTTTGAVQVTLNGTEISLTLSKGDSPTTIASNIKSALMNNSTLNTDWTFDLNQNSIVCTAKEDGKKTGKHSYAPNATGASGNVSTVAGQSAGTRPEPSHDQSGTIYDKSETGKSTGKYGILNEFYRKEIKKGTGLYADDGIHFLDSNGQVTTNPTNIIEIKVTFTEKEGLLNGGDAQWRTFGIVGGAGASTTLGSGLFMNAKNHPVITKTKPELDSSGNVISGMVVERKIKFTFTNANI